MKKYIVLLSLVLIINLSSCMVDQNQGSKSKDKLEISSGTLENIGDQKLSDKKNLSVEKQGDDYKLIATSPALCDIAEKLDLKLVGRPTELISKIPEIYMSASDIGSPMGPDLEKIRVLKPTEIVCPDTLEFMLKKPFTEANLPVTYLNLRSVDGLYESLEYLGNRYGKEEKVKEILKEYEDYKTELKNNAKSNEKPKVLVLVGLPSSYLVATNKSYVGSLVEMAGGDIIFRSDDKDFLNINTEEMLNKDPDFIIRTAHGIPEEAIKMFEKEFSQNDIWKHFRAVKTDKVYDVDYMVFGMSAKFTYPDAIRTLNIIFEGDE